MDLTGYGYKPPVQETKIAARPVPQSMQARSSELTGGALRLLDSVARRCPMQESAARFPRVLNRLAEVWNDPTRAERCFEELMLDSRCTRAGFPSEVLSELMVLRTYNASRISPKRIDPWQEMHLR
jgi:hypothetical protein